MFLCTVTKANLDAQHLWFGRRATTRIRSELMAAIYDKALKRRDYSGITKLEDKETGPVPSSDATKAKEGDKKAAPESSDDPRAGADVGKIVNLMAGDANRVSRTRIHHSTHSPLSIDFQHGQRCLLPL